MGLRLLAWLLWPLGMALQTSVVVIAGWSDPDSVRRVMVRPRVGALPIRTRGRAWYLACEQPLGGTVADRHVFWGTSSSTGTTVSPILWPGSGRCTQFI